MAGNEAGYSMDELLKFLDYTGEKRLVKRATATARRTACNRVLDVLDSSERADLRAVDLENVFSRFSNLHAQEFSPSSLKTYFERTRKAVEDFIAYRKDPANWKPNVAQRVRDNRSRAAGSRMKERTAGASSPPMEPSRQDDDGSTNRVPSLHVDLQIHIPPEATVDQIEQIFKSMAKYLTPR